MSDEGMRGWQHRRGASGRCRAGGVWAERAGWASAQATVKPAALAAGGLWLAVSA